MTQEPEPQKLLKSPEPEAVDDFRERDEPIYLRYLTPSGDVRFLTRGRVPPAGWVRDQGNASRAGQKKWQREHDTD